MQNQILSLDKIRYGGGRIPLFQIYYRKAQASQNLFLNKIYKIVFLILAKQRGIEFSEKNIIGPGLYFGHAYNITINECADIGCNVNIHKGVTIGQENRGKRKGSPHIGNYVWIGVNATIVGNINVGNDVLIAPNSYVNRDIPDHSIVFGNPCIVKQIENATLDYINRAIDC